MRRTWAVIGVAVFLAGAAEAQLPAGVAEPPPRGRAERWRLRAAGIGCAKAVSPQVIERLAGHQRNAAGQNRRVRCRSLRVIW